MNITLSNLSKTFGDKVAVDINQFEISAGQILGLVGNNGAGKSTLFRLMLDLIKPDSGRVLMGTTDVSQGEEWKDWTGAYIDDSFLIDYLTPDEYFAFIAKVSGITSEQRDAFLEKFSHFMAGELTGQKKLIRNLSAGNKQKVGIVAAMMLQPKILILDEPFNFLDPSSQSAIKRLIVQYNQESGATILISSHNLQHTVDISTRIALLENGHIIRDIEGGDSHAMATLEEYFQLHE